MKKLFHITLCTIIILLTLVGCATTKKPAPKPAPPPKVDKAPRRSSPTNPNTPSPTPITPSPTNPKVQSQRSRNTSHSLAKKLANTAEKIEGVRSATVVVSDSMAFVGLEINSNIQNSKTNEIKNKVINALKKEDKSLKDVSVTTDPNLITRLKKIAQGVEDGKPISGFSKELEEITRRMVPKTK